MTWGRFGFEMLKDNCSYYLSAVLKSGGDAKTAILLIEKWTGQLTSRPMASPPVCSRWN